jgi:hypothetical protein
MLVRVMHTFECILSSGPHHEFEFAQSLLLLAVLLSALPVPLEEGVVIRMVEEVEDREWQGRSES